MQIDNGSAIGGNLDVKLRLLAGLNDFCRVGFATQIDNQWLQTETCHNFSPSETQPAVETQLSSWLAWP